MTPPHPLVIGHRGAPGYRPEHTRSSYRMALDAGVDAVEPDVVVSRDGVLVVRHENEISSTTDVAHRSRFADRRTTKTVDGERLTGWFAEDFTWEELASLRCRERLPELRPESAAFDGAEPMLRLRDLLDLVREDSAARRREIAVVLEIKHATYFSSLGWDVAQLVADDVDAAGWGSGQHPLVVESFEATVLTHVRARGVAATYIYLLADAGRPFDLVAAQGDAAPTYAETAAPRGLDALAGVVDGISVAKRMLFAPTESGAPALSPVAADARERGLLLYTWTCRPENAFLEAFFRTSEDPGEFGDFPAEWAMIRDAGVDGVFVDHPDLGREFFRG